MSDLRYLGKTAKPNSTDLGMTVMLNLTKKKKIIIYFNCYEREKKYKQLKTQLEENKNKNKINITIYNKTSRFTLISLSLDSR
jgi:predicted AAA+ superfamily ATPase